MSHVHPLAVLSNLRGTFYACITIAWLLPVRVTRAAALRMLSLWNGGDAANDKHKVPNTSIWLAIVTSVFAPLLQYNWHLLLARPWWGTDPRDGLLFPPGEDNKLRTARGVNPSPSTKHGFYAFLYTNERSPAYGIPTLKDADAVWLHAHGGGFYAGEARQYHNTYLRWVRKAKGEYGMDLRIVAVEYPLSTDKPYPGCIDAMHAAYRYVLEAGVEASRVVIAGDSAGGNGALSTCFRIYEEPDPGCRLPSPAGVIMLSPWLDLSRTTSGNSPNQPTDWLTTFNSDGCRIEAIEQYMGSAVGSSSDSRVSPLYRRPSSRLPKQFLSAGKAEVLYADAEKWAAKVSGELGSQAIECHFAEGHIHTFAIGGWLADTRVEEDSDRRILHFVHAQTCEHQKKIV